MDIKRNGSQATTRAPADNFTGSVWAQPLFSLGGSPPHTRGTNVAFAPAARTHWHTHPKGQTLIVTSGVGRVQRQGGPIEEIRPGDVIWFPPGEMHWHGAAPDSPMSHMSIVEQIDGKSSDWFDAVTDEQYAGK